MKPLSIYIHIPFCESKCKYCDFVSFDNRAEEIDKYIDVLCNEILSFRATRGVAETPHTIFIGGGTPSILTNEQLSKIFTHLPKASEVTIEANPNSITADKLAHWRDLGINRLSIGVQSFDDEVLKTLGRTHTADQAVTAITLATEYFENINIDLIHSVLPCLEWREESRKLAQALEFVTHVSAYALIIEEGKPFTPIQDTQSIKQQRAIERTLKQHGFKKYEVSNFAREGFKCRHNLAYWQPATHEYIGFGLGAHSLIDNTRFQNTTDLNLYLSGSFRDSSVLCAPRNDSEILTETIMLGLRTTDGVDVALLLHKSSEIEFLKSHKLIKQTRNRISATQKGFFVLNQITQKLT